MENLDAEKEKKQKEAFDSLDELENKEKPTEESEGVDTETENESLKKKVEDLELELEKQKNKVDVIEHIQEKDYPVEVLGLFDCSSKERVQQVKDVLNEILGIPEDDKISSSIGFRYFSKKINERPKADVRIITEYDEVIILDRIFSYLSKHEEILEEIFGENYRNEEIGLSMKEAFYSSEHTRKYDNEINRVSFLKF